MDTPSEAELPAELPLGDIPHSSVPGSQPLKTGWHERMARLVAACMPVIDSGRQAGAPAAMTMQNIYRVAAGPKFKARVRFLAGDTDEVLAAQREAIIRRLKLIAFASMGDYCRIEGEDLISDLTEIGKLDPASQREMLSVIKSITPNEHGTKLELLSPSEAITHLRKILGMDIPSRVEVGGLGGGPIGMEVTRIERHIVRPANQDG